MGTMLGETAGGGVRPRCLFRYFISPVLRFGEEGELSSRSKLWSSERRVGADACVGLHDALGACSVRGSFGGQCVSTRASGKALRRSTKHRQRPFEL